MPACRRQPVQTPCPPLLGVFVRDAVIYFMEFPEILGLSGTGNTRDQMIRSKIMGMIESRRKQGGENLL